ncbi:MAG: hypothetical protein IPN44_10765 [Flavobacteriales bacterium]|nr:hypothetical protein [Flavobacteriales bacterium]
MPLTKAWAIKLICYLTACGFMALAGPAFTQGNDKQLRAQADGLFEKGEYFKALPLYSQLVSLSPADHDLNFKLGTCSIYGKDEKAKAIGFLKYAVQGPSTPALAWYFLGRAYQLDYRFDDALDAYRHFSGTADKKSLDAHPLDALQQQCRNAKFLLSNIKDIDVMSRVEVDANDFFRFYDLGNIGGKIVVTPDELLSSYDRKSGQRFITYLPDGGGPVYFSSYGKSGSTGRDIYRCELLPGGTFSIPVRLAGYVNTDQDEDYAVMSQDRKTLYFCSKGHNSMGGYDVFKCAYDAGMDVFGTPENMDFAVNSPADELLYITDPEGKQACFASDRDSRQGMVNVYRVGTEQAPISITVLKGTFASAVYPTDRKARIFVEDMLTHERVADVATDDSGKYLVALPRGGQYQFKVETGATGGRLLATVDVPKSDVAVAYKQEMRVNGPAGDKLELTSHFDTPMTGDVLAMAMDEIKRRARLEVTGERMQPLAASVPTNSGDPLALAGFGTKSLAEVKSLAQEEANQRQQEAGQQKKQADRSYQLALNSVEKAEAASANAKALAQEAVQVNDPVASERLLYKAALARQEADDANLRAKAAYGTAHDLDSTARIAAQEAQQAATVANSVDQGVTSGNTANLTEALKRLKIAVDARSGPKARLESAERMRREASEATMASGKKVQQAMAARQEESDFAERVNAQKRSAEGAKGGKKESVERQLADMQAQLSALHDEADASFAQARNAEEAAAAARGKAALAKYLAENDQQQGAPPSADQVVTLASRISRVQRDNAGLAIPEEYRPVATETAEQRQQRLFDWGTGSYTADAASSTTLARVAGQNAGSSTATAPVTGTNSATRDRGNDQAAVNSRDVPGSGTVNNGTTTDLKDTNSPDITALSGSSNGGNNGMVPDQGGQVSPITEPSNTSLTTITGSGSDQTRTDEQEDALAADDASMADALLNDVDTLLDLAGSDTVNEEDPTNALMELDTVPDVSEAGVPDLEEQAFFTSNALAELQQLRGSAPDRHTRDSLDMAIAKKRRELSALAKGETLATTGGISEATPVSSYAPPSGTRTASVATQAKEEDNKSTSGPEVAVGIKTDSAALAEQRTGVTLGVRDPGTTTSMAPAVGLGASGSVPTESFGMEYSELAFDPAMLDPDLAEELVPGIMMEFKRARMSGEVGVQKGADAQRLQKQLMDSIDARSVRQAAYLEANPEATSRILPQMERLRLLKAAMQTGPENALARVFEAKDAESATTVSGSPAVHIDESALPNMAFSPALSADDNTAYVDPALDLEHIYETRITYRSKDLGAEIAAKDSDVSAIRRMRREVDSLEAEIKQIPGTTLHERLRSETDKKIDALLVRQTDLGQRLDFVARKEYAAALDSARSLQASMSRKELPASAPLPQMAQGFEASAKSAMDEAAGFRKQGDRSKNIMDRDNFYRQAWSSDIQAFQLMDRSHTVRNYMLRDGVDPNEQLAYEQVVDRMFGTQLPTLVQTVPSMDTANVASGTGGQFAEPALAESSSVAGGSVPAANALPQADPGDVAARSVQAAPAVIVPGPDGANVTPTAAVRPTPETVEADATDRVSAIGPLPGYLEKHYELAAGTKDSLVNDAQARVYFMLRGSALEHADSAKWALADANEMAATADRLKRGTIGQDQGSTLDQATLLQVRSDSLRMVSLKQSHAAALDNAAAEHLISGLSIERSGTITAMELSNRRSALQGTPIATGIPVVDSRQVPPAITPVTIAPVETAAVRTGSDTPSNQPVTGERTSNANEAAASAAPLPRTLAPLVADNFEVRSAGAAREMPIPVDAPMPQGVVYKIQVGAFRNELPKEAFSDMTPVTGESVGNGLTRYAAGQFTTAQSAAKAGEQVRSRGYSDAFVVAYLDGKRISLRDAIAAERVLIGSNADSGVGQPTMASDAAVPSAIPIVPTSATAPAEGSNAEGEEAVLLAKYPTTVQEVLARFNPNEASTEYYNDPAAAPAKQVETVKGLFFTVQVGVYSKPTALDRLFNITPLNSERTENGKIRYTTGVFQDPGTASTRKNATVQLGVKDAYVTAYLNGKRIPVGEGRALLAKFGPSILADPALGNR